LSQPYSSTSELEENELQQQAEGGNTVAEDTQKIKVMNTTAKRTRQNDK
jgi:hypothetical protein